MNQDTQSPVRIRSGLGWSLYGVWFRHVQVYRQTLVANALPPVLEPLLFFSALAFGLGPYLPEFGDMPYRTFIASGIVVASSMYTGVFETTFGTFVRLVTSEPMMRCWARIFGSAKCSSESYSFAQARAFYSP